jgi:acetyl-CoA C-acetyltransferase
MDDVFIVAAKRTPIGRFQGVFKDISAPRLGASAISAALSVAGVDKFAVDQVIFGNVLTAGVGQAPARQAALYAGLPEHVRALTVGKVCGSGLQSVVLGAQSIICQDAQVVVAGGQESMTNAPYLLPEGRVGMRMGDKKIVDSMISDGLWDPYNQLHMGNCAEACAKEFHISREEQDAFALESYARARASLEKGLFEKEIVSVQTLQGKSQVLVSQDEEPLAADLSKMSALKPAFDKEGTITAANASKINDGASALILASGQAVSQHHLKPLAKIVSYGFHAQEPKWFTTAPVAAIQKALQKAHLSVSDIDLFEINEAFALVPLVAMKQLQIPHNKVNIHGGACALGHPIGASGARILTTLIYALQSQNKKRGLAALCIGGGEGIALVVELL